MAAFLGLLFAAMLALATPALAMHPLDEPADRVILTVSGRLAGADAEGTARFDRAMLEALGTVSLTTTTIWTEGTSTFVGVPLRAVLDAVHAQGTVLTALAINDYSVSFPVAEITAHAPILAFLRDGAPMSVRDKGPLWILYPFDAHEAYRTEIILGRSVWQLDRLHVHD